MKNNKIELANSDETGISRREALSKFWKIGLVASAAVMSLTACDSSWDSNSNSNSNEIAPIASTGVVNPSQKEGLELPENNIVNIRMSDGVMYYGLDNYNETTIEMLEYSEESVDTSDKSKNITWAYATFQVKKGNLKVEVITEPKEAVSYKLSIVEDNEVREIIFNVIPEGWEVLVSTPVLNELEPITVLDQDWMIAVAVWTVTWTDILEWADFSILDNPTTSRAYPDWRLKIDSTTWEMTRKGDEMEDDSYEITIQVENTDGWKDTMTFTLNVDDKITL